MRRAQCHKDMKFFCQIAQILKSCADDDPAKGMPDKADSFNDGQFVKGQHKAMKLISQPSSHLSNVSFCKFFICRRGKKNGIRQQLGQFVLDQTYIIGISLKAVDEDYEMVSMACFRVTGWLCINIFYKYGMLILAREFRHFYNLRWLQLLVVF